MGVIRGNKDSVMAMLEAFVHDPLINWRLMQLSPKEPPGKSAAGGGGGADAEGGAEGGASGGGASGGGGVVSGGGSGGGGTAHPAPADGLSHPASLIASSVSDGTNKPALASSALSVSRLGRTEAVPHDEQALNTRARAVLWRVKAKLDGNDFRHEPNPLDVPTQAGRPRRCRGCACPPHVLVVLSQVDRLVMEARSNINLCQCYVGWCPFW